MSWPKRTWRPWCANGDDATMDDRDPPDGAHQRRTRRSGRACGLVPYAIVGEQCVIGDGCVLAPRATLERNVTLAPIGHRRHRIDPGRRPAGPQVRRRGDRFVEIGEGTVIREYCDHQPRHGTIAADDASAAHCLIMSYVHLAHDCHVGDHVIISNGSQFAGHVTIEDRANDLRARARPTSSRGSAGTASSAGMSRVARDVPPFVRPRAIPIKLYGLNSVGLQRNGFPAEDRSASSSGPTALLFRSELNVSQALEQAAAEAQARSPKVQELIEFMQASPRGVSF